jgi:hypothetical protein
VIEFKKHFKETPANVVIMTSTRQQTTTRPDVQPSNKASNPLIRPVNTLLVFRAAAQARHTPGLGLRGLSPRLGIPAPD